MSRQIALRKAGSPSNSAKFGTKCTVISGMNRFFHCSDYRNVLLCSQIRYMRMLVVRRDWRVVLGGAVAVDLIAQVPGQMLRNEVAARLIAASLDLLVATWPRETCPPLRVVTLSATVWQIANLHYMYLYPDNDSAIDECINLARWSEMTVIVAPEQEGVKRRLLTAALRERTPNTWSFDTFISWRTTSASIDQGWPPGWSLRQMLAAYNERTTAVGQGDCTLIEVPRELQ